MARIAVGRLPRLAGFLGAMALVATHAPFPEALRAQVTEGVPVAGPEDATPGWLDDFRVRRDSGLTHSLGTFFEMDDLTAVTTNNTYDLLRRMRGVTVTPVSNRFIPYFVHRPGSGRLGPGMLVMINGAPIGLTSELNLDNLIGVPMIRAIEIYGRGGWVPHEFKHFRGGDGIIIFWT